MSAHNRGRNGRIASAALGVMVSRRASTAPEPLPMFGCGVWRAPDRLTAPPRIADTDCEWMGGKE